MESSEAPPPAAPPELPAPWQEWCADTCGSLSDRLILRSLRTVTPNASSSASVLVDGRTHMQWMDNAPSAGETQQPHGVSIELGMFATNDYLGLSMHPAVRAAAAAAASEHGCGPRSSALVCGYTAAHRSLESSLAELKAAEECLLFPTGYAANLSVLGALADSADCAIFSDELNHASIIDGDSDFLELCAEAAAVGLAALPSLRPTVRIPSWQAACWRAGGGRERRCTSTGTTTSSTSTSCSQAAPLRAS